MPADQAPAAAPLRRHRFYGRRKGHALHARQADLVRALLPSLRVDPRALQPVSQRWLEIGFGGGEHLAHQAALHPDIAFIGAEPFVNGIAKLLAAIADRGLDNIRIHDDDARYLLEALPDASLDRIYLLYPDPWPKARHHRRRFVNPDNLRHLHRLLKPGGRFLFASDSADYAAWTVAEIERHGGFEPARRTGEPHAEWIETRYEAKARREGRASVYASFRRQG